MEAAAGVALPHYTAGPSQFRGVQCTMGDRPVHALSRRTQFGRL